MGVSLFFRGSLKSVDLIPTLVADVEDICVSNGWKYFLLNGLGNKKNGATAQSKPKNSDDGDSLSVDLEELGEDFDPGLRGISFQPHEQSEIVELLFDDEGKISNVFAAILTEMGHRKKRGLSWNFVKTQFAGSETHIKIVNLLLYLRKKYFKKLEIKDDGGYYPKKDVETLAHRMDFINDTMATLSDVLENAEFTGTPDEVMEKMQDALNRSLRDANVKIKVIKMDMDNMPEAMRDRLRRKDDDEDLPF